MMTFLAVLIVFSVLILVHEAGHFFMAKKMGVRIEKFAFGFGPKLISFNRGKTEYLICAIPLGGYVKMAGDEPAAKSKGEKWEYFSKTPLERFSIVAAGPVTNYLLAFLLFSLIIFSTGVAELTTEVGKIHKDFPAYSAGLKVGDNIISVNEKDIASWEELVSEVSKDVSGERIKLRAMRDGEPININVMPKIIEGKNIFGQDIKVARIGIESKLKTTKTNLAMAFYYGGRQTIFLTTVTYKALWRMVTREMSLKESAMGPIGIVTEIGKAARRGIIPLISITAYINLAIAIFNLLPIPVLDGGHILFLALEKIRGKRLDPKAEQIITNIALACLVTMVVYVSWNDIIRNWGDALLKFIR